jgi:predicted HAD superfamily Cof-like phosphohydrolase
MHRQQEQVRDFHRACGLVRPLSPTFNWEKLNTPSLDLVLEEYEELREAVLQENPVAVVHELCDLLYVVYGLAVAAGVDLEPFWEEIHRVNMEKAHGPKRADGKQLKPEDWTPADLRPLFKMLYD